MHRAAGNCIAGHKEFLKRQIASNFPQGYSLKFRRRKAGQENVAANLRRFSSILRRCPVLWRKRRKGRKVIARAVVAAIMMTVSSVYGWATPDGINHAHIVGIDESFVDAKHPGSSFPGTEGYSTLDLNRKSGLVLNTIKRNVIGGTADHIQVEIAPLFFDDLAPCVTSLCDLFRRDILLDVNDPGFVGEQRVRPEIDGRRFFCASSHVPAKLPVSLKRLWTAGKPR